MHQAQDRDQWRDLVNLVMNLQVSTSWVTMSFSGRTLTCGASLLVTHLSVACYISCPSHSPSINHRKHKVTHISIFVLVKLKGFSRTNYLLYLLLLLVVYDSRIESSGLFPLRINIWNC
jgi:hypothetical protein